MCLTIPGKILAVDRGVATVRSNKEDVRIDLGLVTDAKVGDWLLFATKRAVKVISESDAREIIDLLGGKYRKIDNSKLPTMLKNIIFNLRADIKYKIKKNDIEYLLSLDQPDELTTLYSEANTLRKMQIEDFVCIHGIIEFSNYCKNSCLYCGIRNESNIERYRMSRDEIIKVAKGAVENEGYKLFVLQSGEDLSYSDDDLLDIIRSIKKQMRVFIFLSVGERSHKFYRDAFDCGASGSLFRFETSNPKLFRYLRPGHSLKQRLESLSNQKKIGYYIATGSMVGLPGQTLSDIADDILMIKKLGNPMLSSGPFIPTKNTPLGANKLNREGSINMMLKYLAICRLVIPTIKIPVTTALETLDKENGRHRGLLAGANALMFSLTPEKYNKKYSIYDNKFRDREKIWQKYGLFKGEESYEMLEESLRGGLNVKSS